jgi:dynein light intermediate chain
MADSSAPPPSTLLKYIPVPVDDPELLIKDPLTIKKKPQLPPLEVKAALEEILSSLFPAIDYEEEGRKLRLLVSQDQASREDLDSLEDDLEKKLKERQARYI